MVIIRRQKPATPDTLKHQFGGLSVRGAFICLEQRYGKGTMSFIWQSQSLTVRDALKELPDYLLDMRCGDFGVVRFFGGPPKNGRWFDGTVLTMLCDASLFEKHTEGMAPSELLGI